MNSSALPQENGGFLAPAPLAVGSLFTGIGGLDRGFEQAGFDVAWQVEFDPFCQAVLKHHWPTTPLYSDVKEFDAATAPAADVVVGGFPCQPFSTLGELRGVNDERWMWPEFARVVRQARPRYVVVENVPALKSNRKAFGTVLADLSALGFDAEWGVVSACSVGAPHLRRRLFIVAYPRGQGRREVTRGAPGDEGPHEGRAEEEDHQPLGDAAASGRAGWWATEPSLDRMADGVPNGTHRRRVLGNAVIPQVAEFIARRVLAIHDEGAVGAERAA